MHVLDFFLIYDSSFDIILWCKMNVDVIIFIRYRSHSR